jgi:hypothetical protein
MIRGYLLAFSSLFFLNYNSSFMKVFLCTITTLFIILNYSVVMREIRLDIFQQVIIQNNTWPSFSDQGILFRLYLHAMSCLWVPAMFIYMHGAQMPFLNIFWQGKSIQEICYILTHDLEYIHLNPGRCHELIFTGFESMYISVHIAFLVLAGFLLYNLIYTHWVYTTIVNQVFQKLIEQQDKLTLTQQKH